MSFFYNCILQNETDPESFYAGIIDYLKARMSKHNAGEFSHTAKLHPSRIKTAIAFTNEPQARNFERYLKTASGRAFAKKRL